MCQDFSGVGVAFLVEFITMRGLWSGLSVVQPPGGRRAVREALSLLGQRQDLNPKLKVGTEASKSINPHYQVGLLYCFWAVE